MTFYLVWFLCCGSVNKNPCKSQNVSESQHVGRPLESSANACIVTNQIDQKILNFDLSLYFRRDKQQKVDDVIHISC